METEQEPVGPQDPQPEPVEEPDGADDVGEEDEDEDAAE